MQELEVNAPELIRSEEVPLSEKPVVLINPLNGEPVDEIIKQEEAEARGYMDLQFMMKYLEDENEYVRYFVINGKKIIVDIARPIYEYKKPIHINHERVLANVAFDGGAIKKMEPIKGCGLHEPICEACSG